MDSKKVLHLLEVICQQILAVFVLLVFWEVWKVSDLDTKGAWHVLLCVAGVALYVAEGVQVFRKESIFFVETPRENRVLPHGILMGLGFLNISIGIILKISEKQNGTHFTSTHGILGLTTWILMFVVVVGGLVTASKNFMTSQKRFLKLCHIILALCAYLFGVITLGFGLHYLMGGDFMSAIAGALKSRNSLIVLLAIYVTYTLVGPITTLVYKMK